MTPQSIELMKVIGPAGNQGVEFWYPKHPLPRMRKTQDIVPLFIAHYETFGIEFWPSWN